MKGDGKRHFKKKWAKSVWKSAKTKDKKTFFFVSFSVLSSLSPFSISLSLLSHTLTPPSLSLPLLSLFSTSFPLSCTSQSAVFNYFQRSNELLDRHKYIDFS